MSKNSQSSGWKHVVAFLLDLIGSFFIIGYIIGLLTGQTTSNGFNLSGLSALLAIALIVAYFVVMNKKFGGTFGKKIMGIVKSN